MPQKKHLVGTKLPDAAVVTTDGSPTKLQAALAGQPGVVYFLRDASCPVCLMHARKLVRASSSGSLAGRRVVLVVPGGRKQAAALASRLRLSGSASVLASGSAHEDAGLGRSMLLQQSGTLLVASDGRIEYARIAMLPTGGFDLAELVSAADSGQVGRVGGPAA